MEQQTGSKLGKEYVKAVYCHLAYLTYMQSTSCKILGWMNHKRLESRLRGEISVTSDMWITTNWKILKEMGISDHLTCLLRTLYAGQEATVRSGHGTTVWFQIGKRVYCHPAYLTCIQCTS